MKKFISIVLLLTSIVTSFNAQEKPNKMTHSIKENYNRIVSIKKWTKTKEVLDYKAYDEGTDNKVTLFYNNNTLEKIIVILYRETFKKETQYYFLNNNLSLEIDQLTSYNAPYQSKGAKQQTDKLFFEDKKLIHFTKEQPGWIMIPEEEVYKIAQGEVDKIIKAL